MEITEMAYEQFLRYSRVQVVKSEWWICSFAVSVKIFGIVVRIVRLVRPQTGKLIKYIVSFGRNLVYGLTLGPILYW